MMTVVAMMAVTITIVMATIRTGVTWICYKKEERDKKYLTST
jgi:hypothetical protein